MKHNRLVSMKQGCIFTESQDSCPERKGGLRWFPLKDQQSFQTAVCPFSRKYGKRSAPNEGLP